MCHHLPKLGIVPESMGVEMECKDIIYILIENYDVQPICVHAEFCSGLVQLGSMLSRRSLGFPTLTRLALTAPPTLYALIVHIH